MLDFPKLANFHNDDLPEQKKFKNEVLKDFWICLVSRETSLLCRKEVLTGKAKFGISGAGKEVPQIAMARAFHKGDFRAGYYRDQTFMFAIGELTVRDFFAQLYADPINDPHSGGRQMIAHYATDFIDKDGAWTKHTDKYNISAGVSSTAGQAARSMGLALGSKIYRALDYLDKEKHFSDNGNEVCFSTIGDASTSEGVFWESLNAAAVAKVPLVCSVWDDGYGISVPVELQTVKGSISKALQGFVIDDEGKGIYLYNVKAWNYPELISLYERAVKLTRETHIPSLIHVDECTQPQGHSTSGSHERYKPKERLEWEANHDCIEIMAKWMLENGIIDSENLQSLRVQAKEYVREQKNIAFKSFHGPVKEKQEKLEKIIQKLSELDQTLVSQSLKELKSYTSPVSSELLRTARKLYSQIAIMDVEKSKELKSWIENEELKAHENYGTHLYSETKNSALNVPVVPAVYSETSENLNGYKIINNFFKMKFEQYDNIVAFGEDVGQIGDVNQGFTGLQEKYSIHRVWDSGIREWTIMGQAIGLAMRGFRPIAEIQYLDYLVYGLPPLMDDLATLRYRSVGKQMAPAIIRTRGHRLEGIWHTGSPIGMILNSLRGIYVLVPRNMVQAAGMYNTMLSSDDPCLLIEVLNGYRRKEILPDNFADFTVPLGVPEILQKGEDVSLVSYGACIQEAEKALIILNQLGISVELIDVQTLIPFDLEHSIAESLKKTNHLVILDEDVPGGASAYILDKILNEQSGFKYLDNNAKCITAKEHRTPYGDDGDYHSKPNAEDIVKCIYQLMQDQQPDRYPKIY